MKNLSFLFRVIRNKLFIVFLLFFCVYSASSEDASMVEVDLPRLESLIKAEREQWEQKVGLQSLQIATLESMNSSLKESNQELIAQNKDLSKRNKILTIISSVCGGAAVTSVIILVLKN